MELLLAASKVQQSTGFNVTLPSAYPGQDQLLRWCNELGPAEACGMVILGIIYILFGYSIFRAVITLNAMVVGALVGGYMGKTGSTALAGSIVGAVIAAAIALPMIRHAVTIMGALFGAVVGASLWRQAGIQADLAWAGALSGLILFGLLSLIIFRGSLIIFTSLQGAVMLVFGVLSLAYKYPSVAASITDFFKTRALYLPIAVLLPAIFGLLYQQAMCPPAPPPAPAKK